MRAQPALLPVTILFGICGRLGTLIGFALSVKCAALILKPDLMFDVAEPYLPEDRQTLFLMLALIPGFAFGGGAIAQILYSTSLLRLRNAMAERLALQAADVKLKVLTPEDFDNRKPVTQVAADMRLGHGKLVAIEAMLVNLIVIASVLLIAFIGGLLIDWVLMSVITAIGMTFVLATAAFRHIQSHDTTRQQQQAQESEQSKIKALAGLIEPEAEVSENRETVGLGLRDLAGTMSDVKSVDQRFNNVSTLILDLGQAVIIVTFLFLLIGSDEAEMPLLIILVLIFRFFISYLQNIARTIIKLGPLYPFLVELWRSLKDADKAAAYLVDKSASTAAFRLGGSSSEPKPLGGQEI
jgi:ABC-type multidrug transport system fused ATPase/permease subunit